MNISEEEFEDFTRGVNALSKIYTRKIKEMETRFQNSCANVNELQEVCKKKQERLTKVITVLDGKTKLNETDIKYIRDILIPK